MATPKNPFDLNANPDQQKLRDKDNADLRHPPPKQSRKPAPNLAPFGMKGIKRGLPSDERHKAPSKPRFELGEKGKLSKVFKPLAPPGKDKGHGHDR
jgi:hypothetical protein